MAVKKTQLYASLWASCDKLRGGMDSSEYKDYILTLLFMKYVTDKFKNKGAYEDIKVFDKAHDKDPDPEKRTGCSFDDFIALKGKKNIGEGMDKIIARLADENTDLKGVIDIAHFNDEKKLGSGKEMVDKLTDLISIFQRPELDFSRNKAEGDDIIGDAYEYLMRKFATESGKSKGQFYTPAEVSRILANRNIKGRGITRSLCVIQRQLKIRSSIPSSLMHTTRHFLIRSRTQSAVLKHYADIPALLQRHWSRCKKRKSSQISNWQTARLLAKRPYSG